MKHLLLFLLFNFTSAWGNSVQTENSIPIYRGNFFTAINTKSGDENILLTLDAKLKQKLRIESTDGTTYTVLSTVTQ